MFITLLRHAEAEKQAPSDSERKLSAKGLHDAAVLAGRLRSAGEKYDSVITSPYRRTIETAETVTRLLGIEDRLLKDERLACGCTRKNLSDIVREHAEASHIMFIGHAPDLGIIAAELLGMPREIEITKTGLLKLDLQFLRPGEARLLYYIIPALLKETAD